MGKGNSIFFYKKDHPILKNEKKLFFLSLDQYNHSFLQMCLIENKHNEISPMKLSQTVHIEG